MNLMHGRDWSGQDVSGWWLSEKLDGWRAVWTGSELQTRQGVTLDAPVWFTAFLPRETPLDGELWAGPGTTCADVFSNVQSGDWSGLMFRPFDVPRSGLTVEDSMRILADLTFPAHVRPVEFRRVESTEEAIGTMREISIRGGEGVMVRKPSSPYAGKRVFHLLKLKPQFC